MTDIYLQFLISSLPIIFKRILTVLGAGICYGASQHSHSGGGLCLEQNAIRIGEWKLIVGDGGMPNTWFPPVNASSHAAAQLEPECEEPSSLYLTGFAHSSNMESPFLAPDDVVDPEGAAPLSCTNQSSWTVGQCRPFGVALAEARVASAAACCAKCTANVKCVSWVYRSDRRSEQASNCWLKSGNSKPSPGKACTSAGTGPFVGPPPPAPPAPPPPPQLYNVVEDPGGACFACHSDRSLLVIVH